MRRHRALIATVLLAGLGAGVASAEKPTHGVEVARLGFLVGEFEGDARSRIPGTPTQTGRMTYRGEWDLDGHIVRSHYDQTMPGSPTTRGLLIFRWQTREATYAFEGYANAPMNPHRLVGRWDGRRLVFEGKMGGASFREYWTPAGADTLHTGMEFQQDGQWITASEAVLVRKR